MPSKQRERELARAKWQRQQERRRARQAAARRRRLIVAALLLGLAALVLAGTLVWRAAADPSPAMPAPANAPSAPVTP